MILMISDDSKAHAGLALRDAILQKGGVVQYVSADRLEIAPCTACGSCGGKTYGRCVLQDDMQTLYPHIVQCQALVLVSPVVFGGLGFHVKKIMDRMAAVGDPRYQVNKGELVKRMGGKGFIYHMVGFGDALSQEERAAFACLHQENITVMSATGRVFLLPEKPDNNELARAAEDLVHG